MKVLTKMNGEKGRSAVAPFVRIVAASALALSLGACSSMGNYSEPAGHVYTDSAQAHPIMVSKKPVYLDVDVERGSGGLTRVQESHVRGFLHQFRNQGTGRIQISSPSGTPNETAAFEAMKDVRSLIAEVGLSDGAVDIEPYHDEGDHQPPIKISFTRYVAQGPQCGDWSDNLGKNDKNTHYKNFGCATQTNLASMVSNPRDLLQPRGHGRRSGGRRDEVYKKYETGEDFTTAEPRQEGQQTVSGIGQ